MLFGVVFIKKNAKKKKKKNAALLKIFSLISPQWKYFRYNSNRFGKL